MIGEDKFAVVIIVMSVIFAGLALYLILLDRKLTRLEKKQKELTTGRKAID